MFQIVISANMILCTVFTQHMYVHRNFSETNFYPKVKSTGRSDIKILESMMVDSMSC